LNTGILSGDCLLNIILLYPKVEYLNPAISAERNNHVFFCCHLHPLTVSLCLFKANYCGSQRVARSLLFRL
jgi:hypothetical protein